MDGDDAEGAAPGKGMKKLTKGWGKVRDASFVADDGRTKGGKESYAQLSLSANLLLFNAHEPVSVDLFKNNLIITCEGKRFKEEATRYMKRLTYKQKLDVKAYELSYEAGFSVSENSEYPDIFQFSHPDLEAPIHLASEDKELFLQTVEGFVGTTAGLTVKKDVKSNNFEKKVMIELMTEKPLNQFLEPVVARFFARCSGASPSRFKLINLTLEGHKSEWRIMEWEGYTPSVKVASAILIDECEGRFINRFQTVTLSVHNQFRKLAFSYDPLEEMRRAAEMETVRRKLKRLFKDGDDNGDGVLEFDEFNAMLRKAKPEITLREIRNMFDEVLAKSGGGDYMDTDTFVQVAQAHNLLSPEALRLRRERYALRKQTKSRPIPSVDAKSSLDILTAVFDNMGEDVRDIEKSKFEDRSHQEYLENKRRNNDHERQLLLLRTKGKVDENETDSLAQAKLKAFVSAFDVKDDLLDDDKVVDEVVFGFFSKEVHEGVKEAYVLIDRSTNPPSIRFKKRAMTVVWVGPPAQGGLGALRFRKIDPKVKGKCELTNGSIFENPERDPEKPMTMFQRLTASANQTLSSKLGGKASK